nr:MAG TPA: hypothetical protein [Caudoviricetes sp.]
MEAERRRSPLRFPIATLTLPLSSGIKIEAAHLHR